MARKRKTDSQVLENHVKAESGCWEWGGALNQFGYGIALRTIDGKPRIKGVHRIAYECWKGPIPDGRQVCHTCDNRKCINPDHLWIGTHTDNMRDMVAKGRHSAQVAERAAREAFNKRQLELAARIAPPRPKTPQEIRDAAKVAFGMLLAEEAKKSA